MNYGLKNHFNIIKYKQLKQPNNTNEKEKYRKLSLFRNSIFTSKPKQSNYKTSKNSPERFYIEKPKNSNIKKNPFSSFNKINLITHINLNHKINEKNFDNLQNFDNLLKTKIIKIKEKKAITTGNSLINSSINLTNNTYNHNNTSSCLNNYIPHSNYNIKTKNKIIHDFNSKIKKKKSKQKKINSSIDDNDKKSISVSDKNHLLYKNLSSTSSKYKNMIKTTYNTIQNKGNHLILQTHLKNSSIFNSTLNYIYKNNLPIKYSKYKLNNQINSKTSYPTQSNSRKNSNEKISIKNKRNYSNSNIQIKYNINNNNNTPLSQRINKQKNNNNNNKNEKIKNKPFNQKAFMNGNRSNNNKSKINSKTNSKDQSKNSSKEIIISKNKKKDKKYTILESFVLNNSCSYKKKNKKNKICHSENSVGKISIIKSNLYKNNVINVKEMRKSENETKNLIENYSKLNINKKTKINNQKEKKKNSKDKKTTSTSIEKKEQKKEKKPKIKIPDSDLETTENNEDILLKYINSILDINKSENNLNESNDSNQSTIKEKYTQYLKDKEIISSYIKEYYIKNKKYPSTKMKFYKYGRLLGKGAFGKVNLSLHVLTGRLVAIKSINKNKIITERQKSKIQIETSIMKTLSSSEHIVKIYETYETKNHICIVMEYISAGDLLSYIRKRSKLTEPIAKYIFKQIILGIQFIHKNKIVHRDIKLDNILIDLNNKIKICDFGVSKKIINNNDLMYEQCGTPTYIAPEILRNKGYEGFGVDVWSSGVVLYAMLSGTVPFKGNDIKELNNGIMKGIYNSINDISNQANHLLKCILEVDPKKRISINDILSHPWLIDVDINNFNFYNLFTNAERILLAKSNVDYRDIKNKDDMIENFNIKNLDTEEENENKNIITKSIILAPFNSSFLLNDEITLSLIDNYDKELIVKNHLIKFSVKVKELNRLYELNNNGEIDNGVVISIDSNDNKFINNISPYPFNNMSFYSKGQSKNFIPNNDIDYNNNNDKNEKDKKNDICDDALNELVKLGYLKSYVKECLDNNEKNYATTSYFLFVKYCY